MEVSNEMSLEELVKFCTTLNLDNTKPGTVTIIVWTKAEFLKKKKIHPHVLRDSGAHYKSLTISPQNPHFRY